MPRTLGRARIAVLLCCTLNAIMGLFGIALIVLPELSIRTVSIFLGIVSILFGITRIIGYFSNDPYRLAFEHDIIFGSVQVLFGLSLLFHGRWLMETICILMAMGMLTDALFKFRMALEARRFGLNRWPLILGASVVTCIPALIGIFMPGHSVNAVIIVFGINILSYALMNLITVLTAVKTTKGTHPIIEEV